MMTAEIATLSEMLELLSSMYLCEPSKAALENWKEMLVADSPIVLDELKKAARNVDTGSTKELDALLWEYTRLFIGPYRLPCPPWESVYTSPKHLMMQESADQILQLYREAGLTINTADVLPDHIGAELNFLAVLLQRTITGTGQEGHCMNMAGRLLSEHLLKWIPGFTTDMENAAESLFYKAVAKTTRNIVEFMGR